MIITRGGDDAFSQGGWGSDDRQTSSLCCCIALVFRRRRRDGDAGWGGHPFGGVPLLVPIGVLLLVPIYYDFWQ